ncbi:Nn.00g048920.m01.CDS01 [Neocucurbitaria sp. VM-36]
MAEQDEVANKVLRRAQVSKMTRTLQNRLALANVKIKNGWESLSLDAIEPVVDVELKRKRPGSSNETMSDVSSVSERFYQPGVLDSSPLAAPMFSDDLRRSGSRSGSSHSQNKRPRFDRTVYPASSNHTRNKVRTSTSASASWKNSFQLPESSPVYHRRHARFGRTHVPSLSFVSETSTVPDPHSPLLSEEDDEDLPITSFQITKSRFRSSPPRAPRTPPPDVARSARLRQSGFTAAGAAREGKTGDDDASLLMYLATSPTPARPGSVKPQMLAPSTPPPKQTPLPSSMMSTPGGGGAPFPGFGLATPSTNLNFAEFLNMTPSPAQVGGSWTRTPIAGKTPAAAREARRRLNFDNLVPPTGDSPRIGTRIGKIEGLGMDLGGELVS